MLATILKSKKGTDVSIRIMDAFVEMRHFIVENKEVYHIGTSLNNAGKRVFSINKLEDKIIIDNLLNNIQTIIY